MWTWFDNSTCNCLNKKKSKRLVIGLLFFVITRLTSHGAGVAGIVEWWCLMISGVKLKFE